VSVAGGSVLLPAIVTVIVIRGATDTVTRRKSEGVIGIGKEIKIVTGKGIETDTATDIAEMTNVILPEKIETVEVTSPKPAMLHPSPMIVNLLDLMLDIAIRSQRMMH
jgi:hypothetical protein